MKGPGTMPTTTTGPGTVADPLAIDAGIRPARAGRLDATARRRAVTLLPPLFVALLALPFILRQNAWWEWQNAYWLLERQAAHVSAHGTPTFFLHTKVATFYPHHLLYGGPLLTVLAYPAAIVGAWPVFVASVVAAMVAGYLGIWWTARNLGLSRGLAVLPALTFSATPYLVTDLYGRGAWTEQIAVNAAAVMLGAATALLWHPDRGRRRALAAMTLSTATVAGTHNLTLMMAGVLLPLVLIALTPMLPGPRDWRQLLRTLGAILAATLLGAGLVGAFLIPNLWFGGMTFVTDANVSQLQLGNIAPSLHPSTVLSPWPVIPASQRGVSYLYAQPPILALVWAVIALVVLAASRSRRSRNAVLSGVPLAALAAALLVLTTTPSWWLHLPAIVQMIQLPVRLVPYVAIACALIIVLALTSLPGGRRRQLLVAGLVAITVAQAGMAVYIAQSTRASSTEGQQVRAVRHDEIGVESEPRMYREPIMFNSLQFRVLNATTGPAPTRPIGGVGMADPATSDVGTVQGESGVGTVELITAAWSPFIRVDGDASLVGRSVEGLAIIRVDRTDPSGAWSATVRPVCSGLCLSGDAPWSMPVGRLLSLFSALALAAIGGLWLRDGLHRRRAGRGAMAEEVR
jgi:hypothetical protein